MTSSGVRLKSALAGIRAGLGFFWATIQIFQHSFPLGRVSGCDGKLGETIPKMTLSDTSHGHNLEGTA